MQRGFLIQKKAYCRGCHENLILPQWDRIITHDEAKAQDLHCEGCGLRLINT